MDPLEAYVAALEKMSTDPSDIDQMRMEDPFGLVYLGCCVITNEGVTIPLANAALASFVRVCVPSVVNTVDSLVEMFSQLDGTAQEKILEALLKSLYFPDESIRNQGAFTLANVFRIKYQTKEWPEIFFQLFELLSSPEANDDLFCGVMQAYYEIFNGNIITISFKNFKRSVAAVFEAAASILQQEVQEETKSYAVKAVTAYFKNYDQMQALRYLPEEIQLQPFHDLLKQCIESCETAGFYRSLMDCTYHMVKACIVASKPAEVNKNAIDLMRNVCEPTESVTSDVEKFSIFINTWTRMMKLCVDCKWHSLYREVFREFFSKLHECIIAIFGIEYEEDYTTYDSVASIKQNAANLLYMLAKGTNATKDVEEDQEEMEVISATFSERLGSENIEEVKLALIMFDAFARIIDEETLIQTFELLQQLTACEDDEARILAFRDLKKYVKKRGMLLSDEEYMALIAIARSTLERESEDDKIESLNVLNFAIRLRSHNEVMSVIGTNFNDFNAVLQEFIASEGSTEMVKITAFNALANLIGCLPISCDSEIGPLMDAYCSLFEQETDETMKNEYASIIKTLVYMHQTETAPFFERIMSSFIPLLTPEEQKFEEVIKAIEAIVLASGESIAPLFEQIFPILEACINSGQVNFASTAANCLGTFLRVTGIVLSSSVPQIILFLLSKIHDTYSQPDLQIAFLNCLSDVLMNIKNFVDQSPGDFPEEINQAKDALMDFAKSIPVLSLSNTKSTVYDIISECLLCTTRFAEIYAADPAIIEIIAIAETLFKSIQKECKNIYKLNNRFLCVALLLDHQMLCMAMQIEDKGIRNKILILCNKKIVKEILNEALVRRNDSGLDKLANDTLACYNSI